MKKKKLPKYIQEKFKKPQFKIGDVVKWEFLGESGWGVVKKILQANDKITYMVKTKKYTYPCGIQIKEYSSYYAGSIDFEASKNRSNNEQPGVSTTETRIGNQTGKRFYGSNSNTISDTGSNIGTEDGIRISNGQNIKTSTKSKTTIKTTKLDNEFEKQKNFLRRFT